MWLKNSPAKDRILVLISQGYRVLAEYRLLEQMQLKGIYALPSNSCALLWFGVIFIHSGMYAEAVFRFTILLPEDFPEAVSLPTVIFQRNIFHPLICQATHSLDLSGLCQFWDRTENHIWQILQYIQFILADPVGCVESLLQTEASNKEAMRLLQGNLDEYAKQVKKCVSWSISHMFDKPQIKDPHYIVIECYQPTVHLEARTLLNSKSCLTFSTQHSSPSVCVARIEFEHQLKEEEDSQ